MNDRTRRTETPYWKSRIGIGLVVFLAVAGFLLWEEHQAHILGALPLVLILGGCVAMHFFMHGGHNDHPGGNDRSNDGMEK